ncbi:hypothetical protein LCGC14_0441910 [marine sediment metagenome]|uniref:Uncharacterized protein n=1 Tax=marine sediment metagenome TaxID=412755 RepID=A0A0F9T3E6_9ZZZZ
MSCKLKNICPFISITNSICHHRYGRRDKNDKNKIICTHPNNQFQCPLYKLWEEQLDKNDKKKECNTISKKMSGL